jgi:hypothetical protein
MRSAGEGPLQQLALPGHLGELVPGIGGRVVPDRFEALGRGLAAPRQPIQPSHFAVGYRERDRREGESDDAQGHIPS